MKKIRLLVIVTQTLNKINFERFGLNYNQDLITKEYWSLLRIHNQTIYKKYTGHGYRNVNKKNFIYIRNYFDLFCRIKNVKKNEYYYIDASSHLVISLIDILLKLKGCKKLKLLNSHIPNNKLNFFGKIKILNKLSLLFLLKKIISSAAKQIKNIFMKILDTKADYFIIQNQFTFNNFKNNKNKLILSNSYIYNKYKNNKRLPRKKYFIFIDSNIENSFESQLLNYKSHNLDKIKYFESLNRIFCKLEEKFSQFEIKIAYHFRRSNNNNFIFGSNRKIYFDKTFELIRDSKLVIAHNSTALEWAILYKKPILLINYDFFGLISFYNLTTMEHYRKKLSASYINVDSNYNFNVLNSNFYNKLFTVDLKKYQRFINYYLTFKHYNPDSIWDSIEKKIINNKNE